MHAGAGWCLLLTRSHGVITLEKRVQPRGSGEGRVSDYEERPAVAASGV
jgi:hypothetical protein